MKIRKIGPIKLFIIISISLCILNIVFLCLLFHKERITSSSKFTMSYQKLIGVIPGMTANNIPQGNISTFHPLNQGIGITDRESSIKISGRIIFNEYKNGVILVMAKSQNLFMKRSPPDIGFTLLSSPGEYTLEVPKNIGEIYLESVNTQDIFQGPSSSFDVPYGAYINNPLKISSSNIKNVDITINKEIPTPRNTFMSSYRGPTVTVSGKIDFEFWFENPKGLIYIIARSEDAYKKNSYPDIEIKAISTVGEYTIKLPKNIGKIYIETVAMKEGDVHLKPVIDSPVGTYIHNPINIGSQDVKDVNISLLKSKASLMSTYNGPTVSISGRVYFDNYEKDVIWIIARSEVGYRRDFYPDMIATVIPRPGRYSLKLPKNIDKVYIEAANVPEAQTHGDHPPAGDAPYGAYSKNPLMVKDFPIKNIDIKLNTIFSQRAKPLD